MKIKKIKLTEAAEIDTSNSAKQIAKELQADAADAGKGLSDTAAANAADTIKQAADKFEADTVVAGVNSNKREYVASIKNELTAALDECLEIANEQRFEGISDYPNLLVSGLPGSAKTASIENWAATTMGENGKPINLVPIDAKNPELYAFLCGYPIQDPNNKLRITQAASSSLIALEKENSVLFLDEFNRQQKQGIRGSLLSLINEHKVTGENGAPHYFNNLLFTVIAINPYSGADDEGATELNPAESARFPNSVMGFNSDPDTSANYYEEYFKNKKAKDFIAQYGLNDPRASKSIEKFLRIWDLGTFIVRHPDFKYDTETEQTKIADSHKALALLCQRMLTQGLLIARGKQEAMINWVEKKSRFLPDDITMLKEILLDYVEPTFEALLKKAGFDKDVAAAGGVQQSTTQTAIADDDDDELDFGDGKEDDIGITTGDALSQDDADALNTTNGISKITDTIGSWMR